MNIAQHNIRRIEAIAAEQRRPEDDVLNEAIDRGLPPAPPLSPADERELAASQKAAMLELLKELEGLPLGDLDENTSENHDQILYGEGA